VLEHASDRLDNASPSNIARLTTLAQASIEDNASRLKDTCRRLTPRWRRIGVRCAV